MRLYKKYEFCKSKDCDFYFPKNRFEKENCSCFRYKLCPCTAKEFHKWLNEDEFKKLYLGNFELSEKEKRLNEIAEYYHTICETFDRSICTGPIINDSIQPMSAYETGMIARNAIKVLKECLSIGEKEGYTTSEIRKAIRNHYKGK